MEWELLEELGHQTTSYMGETGEDEQRCHFSDLSVSLHPKSLKLFYINALIVRL